MPLVVMLRSENPSVPKRADQVEDTGRTTGFMTGDAHGVNAEGEGDVQRSG